MKTITMREFQLNAAKLLSELPLNLTRYGQVVATVVIPTISVGEIKFGVPKVEPKIQVKKRVLKEQELLQKEIGIVSPVGPVGPTFSTGPVKTLYVDGKRYLIDEFGNEVKAP